MIIFHRINHLFISSKARNAYFSARPEKYSLIYSFPYIRVGAAVNKTKKKQMFFTLPAAPVSAALEIQSIIPPESTVVCAMLCVAINAAFFGVGHVFNNYIGKVYINAAGDKAKFAYLGFFGERKEVEFPIEEIEFSDDVSGKLYTKVRFTNSSLVLKVHEKYSDFCNLNLARKVFGESFMR